MVPTSLVSITMITIAVKDQSGKETGAKYEFDPAEFADGINKQLLHDAAVMYQANLRLGTAKTKSRAEVAGSSHKLFKQKGTGNARMGNKRTPIRRGGGHCFAKRPKDWSYRLPRKALRIATRMALLSKFMDNEAVVVDKLTLAQPKTKIVAGVLKNLGLAGKTLVLTTADLDQSVFRSARNIPGVTVAPAAQLNAFELLRRRHFVVTVEALDRLRGKGAAASKSV